MRTSLLASLRFRLSLLIAVAVLPAVALNIYAALQQQRNATEEIRSSVLRMNRAVVGEQAHVTSGVQELLTALAMVPAIQNAVPGECSAVLSELLSRYPHYTSLSVIRPDGALICRGLRPEEPAHVNGLAVESAFRRALETRAFAIGTYAIGTISRKPVVPFSLPILRADGTVDAVLTITLDLVWLSRYASYADLPAGAAITLFDGTGTVLARFPDPERWVGTRLPDASPLRLLLERPDEGIDEMPGLDGVERLYAYSRLPADTYPVVVTVGMPSTEVFAAADRMLARNLFVLLLLGVAVTGVGWSIATRTILQPVRSLVEVTRRLAAGRLSARAPVASRDGELAELSVAFNEMAESLQRRTAETAEWVAALGRSEERYRSLVEATSAIVWSASAAGEFDSEQAQWGEFTGQSLEEYTGWGWLAAVHPDDRTRIAHAWSRAMEGASLYQAEVRLRRHDGVYRHLQVRATPILDERGAIREWIGVHVDITHRKRAEEERAALLTHEQALRAEAEQANRAKSDFLAIVSHELRTPLTSIISYAELMSANVGDTLGDQHREYVERIDASAWHLKELVDQILDFTRLEAGRVSVQPLPTDVVALVSDVTLHVAPLAYAKDLAFHTEFPDRTIVVDTDPTKLRQIVLNLLSNAIKFCDAGEVRVEVVPGCGSVQIRIGDTGPGIEPRHLARIWDTFWQAENPLTRRAGGAGLGLAIVRRLCDLLGAAVEVESALGEGSTFTLTLQTEPAPDTPRRRLAADAVEV